MRVRFGFLALCLTVLVGCGGGSGTTGNLRFVQASPDAPLVDLYVNGKLQNANLDYSNATGYFSINSGAHLQILPSNSAKPILDTRVPVNASANETLIMTGPAASPSSILLNDGGTTAVTGDGSVRVVNASRGMGTPDVYIVPAGANISNLVPTTTNLGFNSNTGYIATPVGAYEVLMTATGTKNVLLDTGSISLSASSNQTVIGLDAVGGGFMFTALTDQ